MERDYENDYPSWLADHPAEYQGMPTPDGSGMPVPAPNVAAPPTATPPGVTPPPAAPTVTGKTPEQIETEGREYDRQHGLIGGYMMNGQWVNGSPTSSTGGGGVGGGGKFDYGRPDGMLGFSPYREMSPFNFSQGAFKYDAFTPTNRNDLYDDNQNPGFVKSQDRLRKMIEAGAAYKGVLRSGNTFNELGSILGNNEEQQFKSFDDRRFRNWGGNRENAADAWSRNLGAEQWSYDQSSQENSRFNNYRFNTEDASFKDALSRWETLVNATSNAARPV